MNSLFVAKELNECSENVVDWLYGKEQMLTKAKRVERERQELRTEVRERVSDAKDGERVHQAEVVKVVKLNLVLLVTGLAVVTWFVLSH